MDLKATYDRIAKDWDSDHTHDKWWKEGLEKFATFLRPGAEVLDVGCGSGVKSEILKGKGMKVTGIDFSERMLDIARRRVPDEEFLMVDLYDLSGFEKKFDALFAQAVLLHFPLKDVSVIIRSLKEKLNSGGYFYAAVKERRPGEKEEEVVKEDDYGYEYERFFSYFTAKELKKYFTDEGFEIVYESSISSGRRNWLQIIGKSA
jgi:SAM-dependent methyltransferase